MVGLLINTLPVRVAVDPNATLHSWLRELQTQQAEMREYDYSPLVDVQGWSSMKRGSPLFKSVVIFENYPVDVSLREQRGGLQIRDFRAVERFSQFTVPVGAGAELW